MQQTEVAIPNTKTPCIIFSRMACKAANNLYISIEMFDSKYAGLDDCAGVANLTLSARSENAYVMPQEVNKEYFGKHVTMRELCKKMVDVYERYAERNTTSLKNSVCFANNNIFNHYKKIAYFYESFNLFLCLAKKFVAPVLIY